MAQGSRQVQTQAQQQIQTLSPQQILVVKLLELPTVELEERIHSEILDNPALEEGKEMPENEDDNTEYVENEDGNTDSNEDFSLGDYSNEDDIPDYKLQEHNRSKEGVAEEIPFSDAVSFYEILKDQLQMQELTPEQRDIAEYLIGSLDDDGLLRKNMESIMDELAIYRGIYTTEEELNKILEIIQDFDPAGIGARSLQECLLLQIQRKADSPLKQIELDIIGKCCDEFTRKNKERIIQKLGITEEQYNEAVSDLTKLNPRPGSFSRRNLLPWMSNQMSRSNVLIQECSDFFCCDGLILTLNRDGDGFALLDAKSHDCHQLAHITGLAIFFEGDLAGILLCQLDQQTGGAGVDTKFVLDGISKLFHGFSFISFFFGVQKGQIRRRSRSPA